MNWWIVAFALGTGIALAGVDKQCSPRMVIVGILIMTLVFLVRINT